MPGCQTRVRPPSTYMTWPVTNADCVGAEEQEGPTRSRRGRGGRPGRDRPAVAHAGLVEVGAGQVGLGVAGGDGVDGDAVRRPLACHDAAELVDAALGGRVRRVVRVRQQSGDRGQEDDPAVATGHHQGAGRLSAPDGAVEVDVDDPLPDVVGRLEHRAAVVDADRVHEDVEAAHRLGGLVDRGTSALWVGEVGRAGRDRESCLHGLLGEGGKSLLVDVRDGHAGTVLGEAEGRSRTDAAGTGHQGRAMIESEPVIHARDERRWCVIRTTFVSIIGTCGSSMPLLGTALHVLRRAHDTRRHDSVAPPRPR